MSCQKCGSDTTGDVCRACKQLEKLEDAASRMKLSGDERGEIRRDDCLAIVPSSGEQCENSQTEDELCGNHARARSVTRVDEIDVAPYETLRDELVDVGLNGTHAFALAAVTDDASHLFDLATSLDHVAAGGKEYEPSTLATLASTIAKHPDADPDDHPLAEDACIALTDSDKFDGRCTNNGYGTGLLCGTHKQANDPPTIYDDDAPDEHAVDYPTVGVAGTEALFVDERGLDAIVIDTTDWEVKRVPLEDVDDDDLLAARSSRRSRYDDQDEKNQAVRAEDPDMSDAETKDEPDKYAIETLAEFVEGTNDKIRVILENGDEITGDVFDTNVEHGGDERSTIIAFFDGDDGEVYSIRAPRVGETDLSIEDGTDRDGETVYKPVDDVADVESYDPLDEYDPAENEDHVDPFVFDSRTDELEDVGLSGREAEVVACKEQGLTHPKIAEYLELPKSTVDEYSRRARQKVEQARRLVEQIDDVYQ